MKLLTPGPVTLSRRVLKALSKQVVSHRVEEFRRVLKETLELLKQVYECDDEVVLLTGSGTSAVDAMIYSLVKPGDKVVLVSHGEFGLRAYKTLKSRGANVKVVQGDWSKPVDPEFVMSVIDDVKPNILMMIYTETSIGLTYRDAMKISKYAKAYDTVVLVDAVSALAGEKLSVKNYYFDAVASCSQKAIAAPPGLSFIALSDEAIKLVVKTPSKPLYYDLARYLEFHRRNETPFTPAVNLIYALREALREIVEYGVNNWVEKHSVRAERLYSILGKHLEPLVKFESYRSNTVTAFKLPCGVTASDIIRTVKSRGYVIARGMGELREKIIRIGTMGDITLNDINNVINIVIEYLESRASQGT